MPDQLERVALDFYEILGVDKTSSESDIKSSYRKLALKYHPDRNPNNVESTEKFKRISIAYAVLSDPNKRRQYDLIGSSSAFEADFEAMEVDQMSSFHRMLGAMFTKLGVSIPTQITPKVLATAKKLAENLSSSEFDVTIVQLGRTYSGEIERQDAKFYRLELTEEQCRNGLIVSCRSTSMSKFKLLLFDKFGDVRRICESKNCPRFTEANEFFVPFDRMQISETVPLSYLEEEFQNGIPMTFHMLDTFEPSTPVQFEPNEINLFCVFGDNWFRNVKFQLTFVASESSNESEIVSTIKSIEDTLQNKKIELDSFKGEFLEVKRQYDEAVQKLAKDESEIGVLLKQRDLAYEEFLHNSSKKYESLQDVVEDKAGIFSGIWSAVFGAK